MINENININKDCECGCGRKVKEGNRFICGHTWKSKKNIEHSKRMKGKNHPMYGKEGYWKNKEGPWKNKKRPEHSVNISGENNPNYHKKRPEHSKRMKGYSNPMYGKRGTNSPHYGKKRTEETKRKQRESALTNVEKNGGPAIGKHENQMLNELEKLYCYKVDRTFRIIGYKVDGYIKELNLCIEIDEPYHFDCNGDLRIKDIIRQREIENELNCKFLRIKD